jgi:hypothetical protein
MDVTTAPIIGTILTKPLVFQTDRGPITYDATEFQVVDRLSGEMGIIYVCNKWYKSGVPQVVHEDMVETFTPCS